MNDVRSALIKALGVFFLLLTPLLPACACSGGGGLTCAGGARLVGTSCYCPLGTTSDGAQCQGTPQQGTCGAGAMQINAASGPVCTCPDNWIWSDNTQTTCSACSGGAISSGDTCVCPDGTVSDGTQCVAAPVAQQPACSGGAILDDQGGCQCPQGTGWDGTACATVANGTPPPVQQQVIQQRTFQADVSLTCCVNHAKYTCPDEPAFRACATMQPNHGCTRAGGC